MALEAAGRARMAEWQSVAVECSYAHYERLRRLLEGEGAQDLAGDSMRSNPCPHASWARTLPPR